MPTLLGSYSPGEPFDSEFAVYCEDAGPQPPAGARVASRPIVNAPRTVVRGANRVDTCIDWFRFSASSTRLDEVLAFVGEWFNMSPTKGKGRFGMREGWHFGTGVVVQDRDTDSCVVCELPGSMFEILDEHRQVAVITDAVRRGFTPRRLDVAVDVRGEGLTLIADLHAACLASELCGARVFERATKHGADGISGDIVRVGVRGSGGSGRFVRCYEKGLETGTASIGRWVRFEAEFSDECAQKVALAIADAHRAGLDCGSVMFSHAVGCFELRENNGEEHTARRPLVGWWADFIGGGGVRVKATRIASTFRGWASWVERCVAPQALAYASILGGTVEALWSRLYANLQADADALGGVVAAALRDIASGVWDPHLAEDPEKRAIAVAALEMAVSVGRSCKYGGA